MVRLPLYWRVDLDVEDINRYTTGGLHPVRLGDVFSSTKAQYRVLHKLGRGSFSTVWLAEALQESSHQYVALKIYVARFDPKYELEVFNRVSRTSPAPPNVLQLRDHFSIQGPNGMHTVLVLNVLGSLLSLVMSPNGPGPNLVRKLCHDITVGLAALHCQGIVHGDFHPGNIGVSLPSLNNHSPRQILEYFGNPECTIVLPITHPAVPEAVPPYLVPPISLIDYLIAEDGDLFDGPLHAEIMDLGSAIIVDEQIRPACTAGAVFAPELLFERIVRPTDPGSPPTKASDIWSLACTIYELMFGTRLFYLTDWNSLLGRMAEHCGEVPPKWKEYWDSQEQFRSLSISHATAGAKWDQKLEHFTKGPEGKHAEADVKELFALLRFMLIIEPTRRPSAEEVLKHPWFSHDETGGLGVGRKRDHNATYAESNLEMGIPR